MSEQNTIKIHAYLAHRGVASRRASEKLVVEGKVKVNGEIATIGQRINPYKDKVTVDGKPLTTTTSQSKYYILNKPRNYVSTVNDELGRKTVLHFFPDATERLYPVGRLDVDSEGLLLLTNDGDVAYTLTHPKFQIEKTYQILLHGIPSTPALNLLKRGIKLREGFVKAMNLKILRREEGNTWLEITIREGRYQQVRRMMKRIGYEVDRLVRVKMGPLELGGLPKGTVRELSIEEEHELKEVISQKKHTVAEKAAKIHYS